MHTAYHVIRLEGVLCNGSGNQVPALCAHQNLIASAIDRAREMPVFRLQRRNQIVDDAS